MMRRYGLSRDVCDTVFRLGAGLIGAAAAERGQSAATGGNEEHDLELDAEQFRSMFSLLDRRCNDPARRALDKPYRRQLRRYEPEKDRSRPQWWHDAAPSYAQEVGEAGRRFREANMPLSRLHADERTLYRACHQV